MHRNLREHPVKNILRMLGLLVALVVLTAWLVRGANMGWTKDRIAVKQLDEITGIEAIEYRDRFVPGLEWLGAGMAVAAALAGASFLFRSKTQNKEISL